MDGNVQRPFLILIVLFVFFYSGTESGFGGWIYTYAIEHRIAGETEAAYLTSGFWGALTVGRLLAIPLTARFEPRFILTGDMIGCLLSVGTLWIGSDSLVLTWIGTIGLGLSMASVFPTALAFGERHMTMRGRVVRWFFVGAGTGAMIFPWLIGQWLEQIGPNVLTYGIGLCITMSLLLLTLLTGFITRNEVATAATT
jgi:FHS family Na+ dependent glucose MFS transporter 1